MKAFEWLKKARVEGFAIGAFNAASIETLKAIVGAAKKLRSPVIVEASPGEADFFGVNELVSVVGSLEKDTGVPIILNLDHAREYLSCRAAIAAGFDYIHFDGSKLPLEKNLEITKMGVEEAHAKGIPVEGELDYIGGSSADLRQQSAEDSQKPANYTDPARALDFVEKTGVDTLAVFVGNVHGLYAGEKRIDLTLLKRIRESIQGKFFSLHGGSGIGSEQLKEAVSLGVVKINVNSELRVAFRDSLRRVLQEEQARDEVAIYKIMPEAVEAVQKIVEEKIKLFGSDGKI